MAADPALGYAKELAERARTDPRVVDMQQLLETHQGMTRERFQASFVSYWMALECMQAADEVEQGKWNVDLEPMMRSHGFKEEWIAVGRTDFTFAVLLGR
jgi:hypothetical protein